MRPPLQSVVVVNVKAGLAFLALDLECLGLAHERLREHLNDLWVDVLLLDALDCVVFEGVGLGVGVVLSTMSAKSRWQG